MRDSAITVPHQEHFSCDLAQESERHVVFLQTLHLNDISIQKPTIEAFRRYTKLWLPLVYNREYLASSNEANSELGPGLGLIPPGDIAWLWHCHRLAPYRYVKYVQDELFGNKHESATTTTATAPFTLDPRHPFVVQLEDNTKNGSFDQSKHADAADYTKTVWEETYPTEPFFVEQSSQSILDTINYQEQKEQQPNDAATNPKLNGFDLIESCQRQGTFLWQVSQINFQDKLFLQQGTHNYYNFMSLMKKGNERPRYLVPTYQIDLMWHTHMLFSIGMYHEDCKKVIGTILEHDDSLTDRSEGSTLDTNFNATKSLWYDVYNVEYKVPGGMYRGEPPKSFFNANWVARTGVKQYHSHHHVLEDILPDGLTYAHLIGEVGASSAGTYGSRLSWESIDSADMFIPLQPKSTIRTVNANEKKEGYAFGDGVKGIGYYHMNTKEAYQIILKRLEAKKVQAKRNTILGIVLLCTIIAAPIGFYLYLNGQQETMGVGLVVMGFAIITGILGIVRIIKGKKEAEYFDNLIQMTNLRMNSSGPTAEFDIPDKLKGFHAKHRTADNRTAGNNHSHDSGYYHGGFYLNGAGCGAGYSGGGGCGAGACGAAGCGGGGGG